LATEKFFSEDVFNPVLSEFKKYHPSGNLKFDYLGISQKLKIAYFHKKILLTSLKQNFTPNTLGSFGLSCTVLHGAITSLVTKRKTLEVKNHRFQFYWGSK